MNIGDNITFEKNGQTLNGVIVWKSDIDYRVKTSDGTIHKVAK